MNNFGTESSNGYAFNDSHRLVDEIVENFMDRSHKLYCKMDALAENKRWSHPYTLEAGMSSERVQSSNLRASSSKRKGTVLMNAAGEEVERLNARLKALEEEAQVMKQAFLESMEERKKLINDIYQLFQVIHHHLHSRNQATAEKSSDGVMIINFHENERTGTGLSQVLCQDSNPSLVNRRATMVSLEEPFSNR